MDDRVQEEMNNHPQFFPLPGTRHVHIIHTVGPVGKNGTQQFPKLTDSELVAIIRPLVQTKIIKVYCVKGGESQNARNILANLRKILRCAKEIFMQVEREHGYCSCECLCAIQRIQVAHGEVCDWVYRALMVCLTMADLQIQLDEMDKRNGDSSGARHPTAPHRTPSKDYKRTEDKDEKVRKLMEKLDQLHKESEAIHREIQQELNSDD